MFSYLLYGHPLLVAGIRRVSIISPPSIIAAVEDYRATKISKQYVDLSDTKPWHNTMFIFYFWGEIHDIYTPVGILISKVLTLMWKALIYRAAFTTQGHIS